MTDKLAANEVMVDGRYYWSPVFSYDNTNNAGTYRHTYETTRQKTIKSRQLLESQFKITSAYTFNSKASATVSFEGLGEGSGSVEHKFHIDTAYELANTSETTTTIDEITKETRSYEIGPRSVAELWQLCYETSGVTVMADVFASHPVEDIIVKLKFSCHRHLVGFAELMQQFAATRPASSNVGEWQAIRDNIIKYSSEPVLVQFRRFVDVLETIRPARDNQGEWEAIRTTCAELDRVWGDDNAWGTGSADKQKLFNKLLLRFQSIVPARDNQGEWANIRDLCGKILAAQQADLLNAG